MTPIKTLTLAALWTVFGTLAIAQEPEPDLTSGVLFGDPAATSELKIYASIGCPYCLEFLSNTHTELLALAQTGQASVEVIEIPGYIGSGKNRDLASRRARKMSAYLHCISQEKEPWDYMRAVLSVIDTAQTVVRAKGDWKDGEVSWQNWAHADQTDLPAALDQDISDLMLELALPLLDMDKEDCTIDSDGFRALAKARSSLLSDLDYASFPVISLNGEIKTTTDMYEIFCGAGSWESCMRFGTDVLHEVGRPDRHRVAKSAFREACKTSGGACNVLAHLVSQQGTEVYDLDYAFAALLEGCDEHDYNKSCFELGAFLTTNPSLKEDAPRLAHISFMRGCILKSIESCQAVAKNLTSSSELVDASAMEFIQQSAEGAAEFSQHQTNCSQGDSDACGSLGYTYSRVWAAQQ